MDTILHQLPNKVSKNLVQKLNENDAWLDIIERINPFMDRYVQYKNAYSVIYTA